MKKFTKVVMAVFFALGLSVIGEGHWSDSTYSSTYSPIAVESHSCAASIMFYGFCTYKVESTGNKAKISHALAAASGASITNRCDSSGGSGAVLNASIMTGKKKTHTVPSHTPINAIASATGVINFSASVNGTAQTSSSCSAGASASGTISCAGRSSSSSPASLSVTGSVTASTSGTISVGRDGVSVTSISAPGSFASTQSHSASLTIQDQPILSSNVTIVGNATASTTGAAVSNGFLRVCLATISADTSAEIILTLDVECPSGA